MKLVNQNCVYYSKGQSRNLFKLSSRYNTFTVFLNVFCGILGVDGIIQVCYNGPADITLRGKKMITKS